jgi:hypothetical protein
MHYWVLAQCCSGVDKDADDFNNDVAVATLEILQKSKDLKEAMEAVIIDKPMALTEIQSG